jgi:hypothetical protein
MNNECLLITHLGLGDLILCNGLIREIKKKYDKVFIPVKKHNIFNFRDLFKDDLNVKPLSVSDDNEALLFDNGLFTNSLKLGIFSNSYINSNNFCESFYIQANVEYSKRWDSFVYVRDLNKENMLFNLLNKNDNFVFVHDDPTRNLKINKQFNNVISPIHKFGESNEFTIFNYGLVLEKAQEIHCIDSSFACFIDHIPSLKDKPKFIHRYVRKNNNNPYYKNNWTILNE